MIEIGLNKKDNLVIRFSYDKDLVDLMHQLPSRAFNKKTKLWEIPLLDLPILRDVIEPYVMQHRIKPSITPTAKKRYFELLEHLKELQRISQLQDIEYDMVGLKSTVQLYPFQRVGATYLEKAKRALLAFDMGLGKAQPMYSKILCEDGWKEMGKIKIGDKIFNENGNINKVIGIYPQGKVKIYEIRFSDDSKTRCSSEHLWNVITATRKHRNNDYKTMTLSEILKSKNIKKYFIPVIKPIKFKKKKLKIDPYVLGLLLGDGCFRQNKILFSTSDRELLVSLNKYVKSINLNLKKSYDKYGYEVVSSGENILKNYIEDMGLKDKLSHQKFIPEEYLYSSVQQRLELLKGLMDTDGTVYSDGIKSSKRVEFCTTSPQLCDGVTNLIRSLGGIALVRKQQTKYTYKNIKKIGKVSYKININFGNDINPFKLKRKKESYNGKFKYKQTRSIKSIEFIGLEYAQCIKTNAPNSLYVTDDFIVTHNTITTLAAVAKLKTKEKIKNSLIICPASIKYNWAIEIAKFTDYTYTIINGDAKKRTQQYKNSSDFTIVNYDLLRHDITKINDVAWDLIIADEIQRIKNYSTAISRNIRTLQPEYIFGLTGTPIENQIMDLFTIMRFIDNSVFGGNGLYFKQRYCNVDSWGGIRGYRDDRHHEIDRKVSYCMLRRKKRDVLDDLPEKIVKFYYITLSDQERRVYNEYKGSTTRDLDVDLSNIREESSSDVLTRIVFLREICDCLNLMESQTDIVSSKLDELKNIMADLEGEPKVVIFTEYERMAQIIQDNMPYQSVHLHGGVKNGCKREDESEKIIRKDNKGLESRELDLRIHEAKQNCKCTGCPYVNDDSLCNTRKKIISKFNNDPNIRLFISTNAGKEGLNLQVAPVVINYDMSFNPAVNEQRIARIDRIGQQSDKIIVINMVCIDTIEEKILKILSEKQALFDKVIDGAGSDDVAVLKKMTIEDLKQLM